VAAVKLVEKLHQQNSGRCDACGKKVKIESAALLPLFDDAFSIRKTANNCLLVCDAALEQLNEYYIRDQILMIAGRFDSFVCPGNKKKSPVEKDAFSRSLKVDSQSRKMNSADKRAKAPPMRSLKPSVEFRSPSEFDFNNEDSVFSGVQIRKNFINKSTARESIGSSKNAPAYSFRREYVDEEPVQGEVRKDANERILEALNSNTLSPSRISIYLDKSGELRLNDFVISKLKEAININAKNFNPATPYQVDEEGVVYLKRQKPDDDLAPNILFSGHYVCRNCGIYGYFLAGESSLCKSCTKGVVQRFY
jgi:hypothetical protein